MIEIEDRPQQNKKITKIWSVNFLKSQNFLVGYFSFWSVFTDLKVIYFSMNESWKTSGNIKTIRIRCLMEAIPQNRYCNYNN